MMITATNGLDLFGCGVQSVDKTFPTSMQQNLNLELSVVHGRRPLAGPCRMSDFIRSIGPGAEASSERAPSNDHQ